MVKRTDQRDASITFRLPTLLKNKLVVQAEYIHDGNISDLLNELLEDSLRKYDGAFNA